MIRIILAVALVISGCSTGSSKSGEVQTGTGAGFQIRKFDTQTLPNGLTILWIPDTTLPYVSLQLLVKSGSAQDPVGKEGLADFTAALLEKGTLRRSATKLSDDMEQIGSGFGMSMQPDYGLAHTSALSFNKDEALKNFTEILLQPTFPEAEVERQRKLYVGALQKLADRPDDYADYLFPKFLYGSHPYGHAGGTTKSLRNLKREDLVKFYGQYFTPGNSVLAVVGQYDEAWRNSVIQAFTGWKTKGSANRDVADFPQWKGTESLLVDRADLKQAQVQIGFKGVPRDIPEYLELRAGLKILGESFGSRLTEEIREKRGLTYGIYAWFDPRLKPGPMGIQTSTRLEKIGETVEETLKTYRAFVKDGVTDEEVATVKALMRGQFPRTFETPESLAQNLLVLNRYGIPVEYLTNYLVNLERMNKDSVNATIRKYFDPTNLRILVYAPRGNAEATLSKLGKVEVKSYKEFLQ